MSDSKTEKSINQKMISIAIPFVVLISILGFFLISYSTSSYGPASTHDSVAYMYAAESLIKGEGFKYFGYDTPFIQWPPLFPIMLSGISLLGCDLIIASGYFNALIFTLIIFFSGYWLIKSTKNFVITIAGTITILASIPLSYVSKYIWSEPLFILLTLLFMISLDNYIYKSSLRFLVEASVFAGLACLTRYIGITAVITGCILLLIQNKKFVNKLLETLIFGFISSIPTTLWIIRNYLLSNTLTGERIPTKNIFSENINITFKTIASWFAPYYSYSTLVIMLGLFIFISVIIIIKNFHKNIGQVEVGENKAYRLLILLIFSLVYTGYLTISASLIAFDSINNRLLVPVYVPITILIFLTLNDMLAYDNYKVRKVLTTCLLFILFTIWLLYPLSEIASSVQYSYENGAGILASKWWNKSQVLDYLKAFEEDKSFYSNFPDAIYIHAGKKAHYTPKKDGLPQYGIERFIESVQNNPNTYIVWFNLATTDTIYSIEELEEYFNIEMVKKFPDGVIYKITGLCRYSINGNLALYINHT